MSTETGYLQTILMQPLLDAPHIRVTDQRTQPFTRPLERQRDPQAVSELKHNDFVRDTKNRSLLASYHPSDVLPAGVDRLGRDVL